MSFLRTHLDLFLRAAAFAQIAVAILNLSLVRIMRWKPDLERMPLLIREVFHVHCFFISLTLATFGVLTWRFADDMASALNPLSIWLAAAIGLFWAVRSIIQWLHYSPIHWRGDSLRTVIHWTLFIGYGALASVYLVSAFGRDV
jgi:hypothetical protein